MNDDPDSFRLGPYTVRIRLRPDNSRFPMFVVMRGDVFVGKSFSRPSLSDAEWLERQNREGTLYASVQTTVYAKRPLRGEALKRHIHRKATK